MKNKMLFSVLSLLLVSLLFSARAFSQDPVVRITPAVVVLPEVGEKFDVEITIEDGKNVAGYQVMVLYDPTALLPVKFRPGSYLPDKAFFGTARRKQLSSEDRVQFAATSSPNEIDGDGTLVTLTFEVLSLKISSLTLVVGNSSTNNGTLLSDKNGTVSFPRVENASVVDTTTRITTYKNRMTLPPDLISEVAFGPNFTYFVLTVQFPTLTGVDPTDVIYMDCAITLDLPGVSRTPVRTPDSNDLRLDDPPYLMFPLETPRQRLESLKAESLVGNTITVATSTVGTVIGGVAGSLILGAGTVTGTVIGSAIGFLVGVVPSVIWNEIKTNKKEEIILASTADPIFLLKSSDSGEETGRPLGAFDVLFLIPQRRIPEIQIKVAQMYRLKSEQTIRTPLLFVEDKTYMAKYEGTWELINVTGAAPGMYLVSLLDYPPFQQMSSEVREYLLGYLETFMNPAAWQIPERTSVLPNYPNPFNPETWIPYQLAEPTDVTLTISDIHGRVVRTLDFGYQPAGIYQNRSRAAYWDGRNALGEPVASGVYFYMLKAGDFTATRKMVIRK